MKTNKNLQKYNWMELIDKKHEFQTMIKLLLEFEEKNGRVKSYNSPDLHFIRKAISMCDIHHLQIWIRHTGAFVYEIIACSSEHRSRISTTWLHEDGIWKERDLYKNNKDHPVHKILCLTDLFISHCQELNIDAMDDWVIHQMEKYFEQVM